MVDIVSWSILIEDLETAYDQLARETPVELPAKATSFLHWAERLAAHANTPELAGQAHHWLNRMPTPTFPLDHPGDPGSSTELRTVSVALRTDLTETLVRRMPVTAGVRADEVLLAALGSVLTRWTGGNRLLIDLEGHGREDLFDDVDISRTVGWFTTIYPVALWLPNRHDDATVLKSVSEQLRAVPDHGIGYGLLRFGSADADLVQDLAALPQAEIILNYTGPRSMGGHAGSPHVRAAKRFTLPPDQLNNVRDPARRRTHLFQVNAGVHDGRLHVHWTYSAQVHDERTVRRLADELRTELTGLIEHASVAEAKATPIAVPSPVRVMADAQVPGATVAVLQDGELTAVHSYGVCVAGGSVPVDPDTLFQAGSISKHLTAMAVLRLVGEGRLDLDEDVNRYLTSWQAPRFPGSTQPLTVRNLLSHLSGLAPVSNQRYLPGEQAPPLLDLLNGRPPVSSPPVHAERAPGAEFRRANVNFSVLQQVLADVTAEPFAPLMRSLVLDPLDMRSSSFDQSFGESSGLRVAHGHDEQGRSIPGGWGIRSELAAAGLWTTAADLSQVVGEVRRAYLGGSSRVLTQAMARQMLTAHSASFYGLGSVVDDLGDDIEFGHGGEPVGYRHMLISRVRAGSGFVVLTNAESGKEVIRFLAAELRGRSLGHGRLAAEWTGDGTGEAMH